ncbi:MAG: hypothetical protein CMI26_01905 [Opitutae bacterium]|nr:hypothetical protein [Opitutae bacterium]|tara:strand:+ start:2167 stop:3420 length:1254 start_codon:yes stop_codon:yes gene_type:complete
MIDFSDKSYHFFEPKPNRCVEAFLRWMNRKFYLRGTTNLIKEVVVMNPEMVVEARKHAGNRLLFLPNHPTHSDPPIMIEVFRQLGLPVSFMAAYDIFLQSKLNAWCMQRTGCFSVDREGSDRKSMKEALRLLKEGERGLIIFPEGNVYLTNDKVTPFLDGPAFIGLKAQQNLGDDHPVFAIPVSLKVTHLSNAAGEVVALFRRLAIEVNEDYDESSDHVTEVKRLGWFALKKVMSGLAKPLDGEVGDDLAGELRNIARQLMEKLELELELSAKDGEDLVDRIRRIRRRIHALRIADKPTLADFKARTLAAEAMLAFRLLSYPGTYLEENPTLDRMGETIQKVLEDLGSAILPPYAGRRALVRFGEPIDLAAESANGKGRVQVAELSRRFEIAVQDGLDLLDFDNDCIGGESFQSLLS